MTNFTLNNEESILQSNKTFIQNNLEKISFEFNENLNDKNVLLFIHFSNEIYQEILAN